MDNLTAVQERIDAALDREANALLELSHTIHANPEIRFEEVKASAWLADALEARGFEVERGVAELPTAFRAVKRGLPGGPTVAVLCEYDALPGLGHACGHNVIATMGAGAGFALAPLMREIPGTLVVMGTPAEEGGGGKVEMIDQGALKDVDMALMAHPSVRTQPWTGSTAIQRFEVSYAGQSAHAAAGPHRGRNALDAVRLLFAGVDAWRQQLPESSRVHGIVTNGGAAPNIIPDKAVCDFFLRSPQDDVLDAMVRRFQAIAKGAAMMTDTAVAIRTKDRPYKAPWLNAPLNDAWVETTAEMKLKPRIDAEMGRVSTDFSDVSQVVPGSHVYFGITRKENLPSHSPQFAEASASPFGVAQMLKAAEALANVGYRYATDDTFRKAVHDAYDEKRRAAKGRKA